jgi:transposase
MRQRTQVINGLRAHLAAELGVTAAQGRDGIKALLAVIADERMNACRYMLVPACSNPAKPNRTLEKRIMAQHRASHESKRLATMPEIGVVGATALQLPSRTRRRSGLGVISRPG